MSCNWSDLAGFFCFPRQKNSFYLSKLKPFFPLVGQKTEFLVHPCIRWRSSLLMESGHWQFTDDGAASNIRFMLACGLPTIFSPHCSNVCLHHVMPLNRLKQSRNNNPFSRSTLILLVEHLEKAKKSASKLNFIMVMKSWKKPASGWSCVLSAFSCSKLQWQQMGLSVPGAPLGAQHTATQVVITKHKIGVKHAKYLAVASWWNCCTSHFSFFQFQSAWNTDGLLTIK